MRRSLAALCLLGPCLLAACVQGPVQPSPTADQVLAAQYRANGEQGRMSGAESQKVMDAYRRDIARPAESEAGPGAIFNGGETSSR